MPTVKPGESSDDYLHRCIPFVLNEGSASDSDQAAAICHSLYDRRHNMSVPAQLRDEHHRQQDLRRRGFEVTPPQIDSDTGTSTKPCYCVAGDSGLIACRDPGNPACRLSGMERTAGGTAEITPAGMEPEPEPNGVHGGINMKSVIRPISGSDEYGLYDHQSGKLISRHKTRAEALDQLAAIEIGKHAHDGG